MVDFRLEIILRLSYFTNLNNGKGLSKFDHNYLVEIFNYLKKKLPLIFNCTILTPKYFPLITSSYNVQIVRRKSPKI